MENPPQAHAAADDAHTQIERQAQIEKNAETGAVRICNFNLDGVENGLHPNVKVCHFEIYESPDCPTIRRA